MNIAFYTGVSGMVSYQEGMDVIAHNMANVNTNGYKPMKASFNDLLYSQMDTNGENKHLVGHGVKVDAVELLYQQGLLTNTNNFLDFALIGDGFFAVDRGGEQPEYTRNGAFTISVESSKGYLVTLDGGYVLDGNGKRITLDKQENSNLYNLEGIQDKIGVYAFPNPYGLIPAPGGSFMQSVNSGAAKVVSGSNSEDLPYKLVQSALESSAVDLAQEMSEVMLTQKAFQFSAKMVQTADQIEEIVNNLR